MTILLNFPILALLGTLFALGYFPVLMPGRWFMNRRLTEAVDAWFPSPASVSGRSSSHRFYELKQQTTD